MRNFLLPTAKIVLFVMVTTASVALPVVVAKGTGRDIISEIISPVNLVYKNALTGVAEMSAVGVNQVSNILTTLSGPVSSLSQKMYCSLNNFLGITSKNCPTKNFEDLAIINDATKIVSAPIKKVTSPIPPTLPTPPRTVAIPASNPVFIEKNIYQSPTTVINGVDKTYVDAQISAVTSALQERISRQSDSLAKSIGNSYTTLNSNSTSNSTVIVGSSSQWTTSGSDIYYSIGKVGIGTTSPTTKLSVAGNGLFDGVVTASSFIATSSASSVFPNARLQMSLLQPT